MSHNKGLKLYSMLKLFTFINYKQQSQKVKVSTDKSFSYCTTECIQGIPHLEIRTNYRNSKIVYVTLRNHFKQCNNDILVFVLAICPTNKEEKQGDTKIIFSWNYLVKLICIIDIRHVLKNTKSSKSQH